MRQPQSEIPVGFTTAPNSTEIGKSKPIWDRLLAAAEQRRPRTAPADLKILVVDDELWSALDMEWVCRKLGHEVVGPAATAQEAIRIAGEERPDLVLMDIRLADASDGVQAATEIRRHFEIPSLFVTAHGDTATRQRAEHAGPAGFIEKPFAPETLALAIIKALDPDRG